MEHKTNVTSENDSQQIWITRDFTISVQKLYQAHTQPDLIQQWMGNTVTHWVAGNNGSYRFEIKGPDGNLVFSAFGSFHSWQKDQSLIRTFEMENSPLPVQLEIFTFEALDDESSRLTMQIICSSLEVKNTLLSMPFAFGIQMAHNKLENIFQPKI